MHATALGVGERAGNTEMDLLLVNLRLAGLIDNDLGVGQLPGQDQPRVHRRHDLGDLLPLDQQGLGELQGRLDVDPVARAGALGVALEDERSGAVAKDVAHHLDHVSAGRLGRRVGSHEASVVEP